MSDHSMRFFEALLGLLNAQRLAIPLTLFENVAIAIGRLGHATPDLLAPHLPLFLQSWCRYSRVLRDNEEKETSFLGICALLERNMAAVGPFMLYLCDAFASWQIPPQELQYRFVTVRFGFLFFIRWFVCFENFCVSSFLADGLRCRDTS